MSFCSFFFFTDLFKKKPQKPIELTWEAINLVPDGGTQVFPKYGTASSIDWSLGIQPVGVPCKSSKLIVDTSAVPGYLGIQVQKYVGGAPVSGWLPYATLQGGASHISVDLSGVPMDGSESFQVQAAYAPAVNSITLPSVKVKMIFTR